MEVLIEIVDRRPQPRAVAGRSLREIGEARPESAPVQFSEGEATIRLRDGDESHVLGVAARGRLLGEGGALLDHFALDRAGEVESLADGAGSGEHFINGE